MGSLEKVFKPFLSFVVVYWAAGVVFSMSFASPLQNLILSLNKIDVAKLNFSPKRLKFICCFN